MKKERIGRFVNRENIHQWGRIGYSTFSSVIFLVCYYYLYFDTVNSLLSLTSRQVESKATALLHNTVHIALDWPQEPSSFYVLASLSNARTIKARLAHSRSLQSHISTSKGSFLNVLILVIYVNWNYDLKLFVHNDNLIPRIIFFLSETQWLLSHLLTYDVCVFLFHF